MGNFLGQKLPTTGPDVTLERQSEGEASIRRQLWVQTQGFVIDLSGTSSCVLRWLSKLPFAIQNPRGTLWDLYPALYLRHSRLYLAPLTLLEALVPTLTHTCLPLLLMLFIHLTTWKSLPLPVTMGSFLETFLKCFPYSLSSTMLAATYLSRSEPASHFLPCPLT